MHVNNENNLFKLTETPDTVKSAVKQMVAFLDKYILSSEFKTYNTFFSGSGKGMDVSYSLESGCLPCYVWFC